MWMQEIRTLVLTLAWQVFYYEAISPATLTQIFITRIPLLQEEHDNMDSYYILSRN